MRKKWRPVLIFVLALAHASAAMADERPINIHIELQVVAVPEALAVPLVADLMKKEKIEAANATIQDLLRKKVAKLIGWPIMTTINGQRAVAEAINRIHFPTEYDPPTVSFTCGADPSRTATIAPKDDKRQLAGIPTAFDSRDVGVTIEVEPILSADGKTIELNLRTQHERLRGFNKMTIDNPPVGGTTVVEQPSFDRMRVSTSLTLRNGERVLLGIFRTNEPPKHIEFFILKADAIAVE